MVNKRLFFFNKKKKQKKKSVKMFLPDSLNRDDYFTRSTRKIHQGGELFFNWYIHLWWHVHLNIKINKKIRESVLSLGG